MGEQQRMRAPAHYLRVDLSDPAEVEYWLVVLDVGRAELERAVACAGPALWEVRNWLHGDAADGRRVEPGGGARAR
jgi:hypothetical protein